MDRTRKLFFVIIGVAVVAAAWVMAMGPNAPRMLPAPKNPKNQQLPVAAPGTVRLTIASMVTTKKWMEALTERFHRTNPKTRAGAPIRVQFTGSGLSGDTTEQIVQGRLKPVVWSPGSASWVEKLKDEWARDGKPPAMSEACKPSIYTPLGLAMWRPMAEVLGWPDKPVLWKAIVSLIENPKGWAAFGRPEWGRFKIGYPHPAYADAGMLFMSSFVYGVVGKKGGLTAREIYAPEVKKAMEALGQNTTAYGLVSKDLLRRMADLGPDFLHAVAAYEEGTIWENRTSADKLRWPLAFIFPAEGTFWGSQPYCILDRAGWVKPEEVEAARMFLRFLLARDQQELAVEHRLRPLDPSIVVKAPLSLDDGTDPRVRITDVPEFELPDAKAIEAIIDRFMYTKRKATVLLVLDVSGSMQGLPIKAATQATVEFLRRLYPADRVGLMRFNDSVELLVGIQQASQVVETLSPRILDLPAGGQTDLHGAVCQSMTIMKKERQNDRTAGDNRLYGIVLLSDGDHYVEGSVSEPEMFATCLPSNAEVDGVKIYPIAFGDKANRKLLTTIAKVTGGRMFEADAESIKKAYKSISAEQ